MMKLVTAFLGLVNLSIMKVNYGQSSCENPTPAIYSQVRQRKMAIIYFSTTVLLIK